MKKHHAIIIQSAIAIIMAWLPTFVLGQTINTTYSSQSVLHKTNTKWNDMRSLWNMSQAAKDMDTFDDTPTNFTNPYTGTSFQPAHTYIDTFYVKKGESIELTLPTIPANADGGRSSTRSYQRWYNFITEGNFYYSGSGWNNTGDLITPKKNCYRFSNGYVSGMNFNTTTNNQSINYGVTFTYPTETQFSDRNISNGNAGNRYYVIACDASGYTDFTEEFSSTSSNSNHYFVTGGYIEPTLSYRAIFYVIAVDDRGGDNETDMWKNGYGRLTNSAYQGGDGDGKQFLEEYDITFPCDHLGNQTDEVVALSKFASGYRISGDSNSNLSVTMSSKAPNGTTNIFSLLSDGTNNSASGGIETVSLTISGQRRTITFRKTGANARTPWNVEDGTTATIVVTKTVSGTIYNIAKFNLIFKKETRLLTQHQLARLDDKRENNTTINDSWYQDSYLYRTPEYLRANYKLLTSRTMDYDPTVAANNEQTTYYPFPLNWDYSSYAFFDGSGNSNFNKSSTISEYNSLPYAEWGTYAITNDYIGYGDKVKNSQKEPTNPSLGGKDGDGYFLYIDASDRPGKIVTLPFTENLCSGSELIISAWVKSADENSTSAENSAMLFTIYGIDEAGNKTPIHRQSTGQITTTSFLSSSDGAEYTDANGYGESQNDWYQLYFSFLNSSAQDYVSYELQVDNNCASTAGGDFYLDEIEVFVAQPTAMISQKEFTCSNSRTLLTMSLNWNQLVARLGIDETFDEIEGIDLCIIDETKYNAYFTNNGIDKDNATIDQIANALEKSCAKIGRASSTGDYDRTISSLFWHDNFSTNKKYVTTGTNLAILNPLVDGTNYQYGFYRTGTVSENNRRLIVDFYSDMLPNRPYIVFLIDRNPTNLDVDPNNPGTTNTWTDFAMLMNEPCAMQSRIYISSQTLIKINGEVADVESDYCEGQTFNFTAQIRVPETTQDADGNTTIVVDPDTGEQQFEVLEGVTVYFDWFFGSQEEYYQANETYGGKSLQSALTSLREHYPDAEDLTNVTIIDGDNGFTQNEYNLIQSYLDADGPTGGLNKRLVLHKSTLDITILSDGLDLVLSPISITRPDAYDEDKWNKICWEYVPLQLTASGKAPSLHIGFNAVQYPEDMATPGLRIGLDQIEHVKTGQGHALYVNLRGAEYVTEGVTSLGLIDNTGDVDYNQIYLIGTTDPAYEHLFTGATTTQYTYPIGRVIDLHAEEYAQGSTYENYAKIRFNLSEQTLDDGTSFQFIPREGYSYTFSVRFAEKGNGINNSCWGTFPVEMKVVPEYLVWQGKDENANWNKDDNWKRADKGDLKKPDSDTSYITNDENTTSNGFVPMLFSNVIIPKDSKAQLYIAGYASGGGSWSNSLRPKTMEEPTENIQYDLMAYMSNDSLTTQRYRVNLCNNIHFERNAQMLHTELLIYNKASMDIPVPTGSWQAISTPLQDIYAGDWYTQTSGTQATEYFKDITFTTDYDRLAPAVYQRSWDTAATIVETSGNTPVSFTTNWSAAYNDASVAYHAGAGYSIKGYLNNATELLFRLPKADTAYDYSTGNISRGNTGRFLMSNLADRSNPLQYIPKENVTVTLTAANGDNGYFMVGNPYTASFDAQAFMTENSDVLVQEYRYIDTSGTAHTVTYNEGAWPETSYLVAPNSVFYVKPATKDATSVDVKFTSDMQKFATSDSNNGETTASAFMVINATGENGMSIATVNYSATATNDYDRLEDAELLTGIGEHEAPRVFTVANNTAISGNQVKDESRIPLGVFANDGETVTISFNNVAAVQDAGLYDAETQSTTRLYDGYELTLTGSSYGRYFLTGTRPGTTGITEVTGEGNIQVSSMLHRQVVVTADTAIKEVTAWSANGTLLRKVTINGDYTCTLEGVASGVAIIKVTTDSHTVTKKLMIR